MSDRFTIGLDFGTNSVRALIVNVETGEEIASAVWNYAHGAYGVILSRDPNLARQHPADYLAGTEFTIKKALAAARENNRKFKPEHVIGIGVDATGSTPLPVDANGQPLAFQKKFSRNDAAMAWLWKDHTSIAEAEEVTSLAKKIRPHYLTKCGGAYSSEWFWSKILHCRRTAPEVFRAAHSWMELADFIPATLTGTTRPEQFVAGVCSAGHKAMWSADWGGYPDEAFLSKLDPQLAQLRRRLTQRIHSIDHAVGGLTAEWARKTGLRPGIRVAVGAIDCHLGAVGGGVQPGTLVKIIGTSSCDITVWPNKKTLADIPGICGIADGSVLPGCFGLEAGQAAVGDIFNWFVNYIQPHGKSGTHDALTADAAKLKPGESGLLALDWNNGNRNILMDQQLTGALIGQTLYTTPAEIYRALIEATAFGGLTIIKRYEEYGVKISNVITCGGIAEKNPLLMQIYADVINRPMKLSRSSQTCALGSAIAAAVVAGAHKDFRAAQKKMTRLKPQVFRPNAKAHAVYREIYALYLQLHRAFGTRDWNGNLFDVMKKPIAIRQRARH